MINSSLDLILRSTPLLFQGVIKTLEIFILSGVLSLVLGVIGGVITCKRYRLWGLSKALDVFTFVMRAVPFYIQLLIAYFVIPDLFNYNIKPFTAAVLSLGFCSFGYMTVLIRAAIQSVASEQWESAFLLGYTNLQTLRYIILPQALRFALPAINNELDSLLKSTAVISSIGVIELTRMGMNIVSREMEPVPIYLSIALLYLVLSTLLNRLSKYIEKRWVYAQN